MRHNFLSFALHGRQAFGQFLTCIFAKSPTSIVMEQGNWSLCGRGDVLRDTFKALVVEFMFVEQCELQVLIRIIA